MFLFRIVVAIIITLHAFLDKPLELGRPVFSKPERIMFHLGVDIPLVNVLVSQEPLDLLA